MKVEFEIEKKKTNIEGKEVEYFVLKRKLATDEYLEVPIKKDKLNMLLLSLKIEKMNK